MPLTNPYTSGTDEYVDFQIWNNGVERFNDPARQYSRRSRQPHELDYLRGFHDSATLAAIKARIAAVTGQTVNVTSFWLDKTAYVFPTTPGVSTKRRELGDLAVVIRDYARRDHSMWILQAKRGHSAAGLLAASGSTLKEIELFEKAPQFQLESWSKAKTNLAFNLEPEFGAPANSANFRHWSFLMFRENPTAPAAAGPSPTQWRWSGSSLSPQTGSFMKGITEMLLSPMDPDHKGAKLLSGVPAGWEGLHDALMSHVPSGVFLGHAGRPMRITAFSTAAPLHLQIGFELLHVVSRIPTRFHRLVNPAGDFQLPPFKFDMISIGHDEGQALQDWKMEMSNNDFWRSVENNISESIDRAIHSEISDDEPPRNGDADFAGGERQPPGNDPDGEDGNGAHPTRATLVIDIGNPRGV